VIDQSTLAAALRGAARAVESEIMRPAPEVPKCLHEDDEQHSPKHAEVRAKQLELLEKCDAEQICAYIDHDRNIPDDLMRRWVILRCALADERQAAAMERIADSLDAWLGLMGGKR